MPCSYRDSQQRFHKGHQGRMLVPHDAQAGLLFTINPKQSLRARREAQNYLSSLTADLQASEGRNSGGPTTVCPGVTETDEAAEGKERPEAGTDGTSRAGTTSGLLALELSAAVSQGGRGKRPRPEPGLPLTERPPVVTPRWFGELETSCKGYLLLRVPSGSPGRTCVPCHAARSQREGLRSCGTDAATDLSQGPSDERAPDAPQEGEGALNRGAMPAHTILINPLVSHLVERIFKDLHENPRPIFKHCFRLMPVELTCCPTLPEMQVALRKLMELHFPPNNSAPPSTYDSLSEVAFTRVLDVAPAQQWPSASQQDNEKATHPADVGIRRNGMHKIVFQLTVKNNSNVEAKKALYLSELQATIPANRFIVLSPSYISPKREDSTKFQIEAVVCVVVLHATCVMGVQPFFSERDAYNVHDISKKTLVLTNSITRLEK
ncbi:unnamed protein product [Phytomonas sp. EM1]|nr:unnamed protein product [Phytomonas sp. EM1]|eukprot:CCW64889.1 unnamed protein product [Phytomonas sp. isolate EM1]